MTETPATPDPKTEPVVTPVTTERRRPSRVTTVAAWVGIVAGVVFIVAVVFFSGFILGKSSGGGGYHHRGDGPGHGQMMFHRDGPPPMMGPRGQFERPMMPGQSGMQPPQQTQTGSPATPAPPRP